LSICNIAPQDDFGVFEIGMSKFKEIFNLSSLVKPDIAIITNISEAHLENFKNIRDIAKAKSEIIYNIQRGGVVILNRDDKFFHYFKKIAEKNI
jgi:murE/murF fusion protein